jgi:hypothetical protein
MRRKKSAGWPVRERSSIHRRITFILGGPRHRALIRRLLAMCQRMWPLSRTRLIVIDRAGVVFVSGEVQRDSRAVVAAGNQNRH